MEMQMHGLDNEKAKRQRVIIVIKHRMTWFSPLISSLMRGSKKAHSLKFVGPNLSNSVHPNKFCTFFSFLCYFATVHPVADLDKKVWRSQNNILKSYIFNYYY